MESLPNELVDMIFFNLEVGDLLNCAKVSTLWRNVANTNRLWKKHCEERFCVDTNSTPLIKAKSHVEPRFEIPANGSDRLTDVCTWRIRYAQEVHIINNFTNGRYVMKKMRDHPKSFWFQKFLQIGEKVVSMCPGMIEVWNIENEVADQEDTIRTCLRISPDNIEIWSREKKVALGDPILPILPSPHGIFLPMNNGFSYIQKNIISHYSMKNGKFFLKLQTAIERPLIDNKMPNIIDRDIEKFSLKLPPINLNNRTTDIIYNDRYVIISRVTGNVITFIVWDVKTLQSSVFYVPFKKNFELRYKELSGKLSSKLVLSFFETSTDGILSDTIFTYDLNSPGSFEKIVVQPMNRVNIRAIDDFVAIGYEDKLSFVRGGKTVSIKCDISGSRFDQCVIKTASYICVLGRQGENLELIQTDLDFNEIDRFDVSISVGSYTDYSLYTIGQDLVSVGCSNAYQPMDRTGDLIDLKRDKINQLPARVLVSASPMRKLMTFYIINLDVFYFW